MVDSNDLIIYGKLNMTQDHVTDESIIKNANNWLINNFQKIDEVVAIVFFGRSGSVFLQSLFDSHPQVIMFPGTILLRYFDFWQEYGKLPKKNLIHSFTTYFAPFFDVNADANYGEWKKPAVAQNFNTMGNDRDEFLSIDRDKFVECMLLLLEKIDICTSREFFQAIHVAYTISLGRAVDLDATRLPVIFYQSHIPYKSLGLLVKDFPKLKILHAIREPLQTLGSHFKHHQEALVLAYSYGTAYPPCGHDKSRAVKLEDLHKNSKPTLQKICEWVGLQWSDTLLESTFDGKKWWNVKGVVQVSGFNEVIISKNHTDVLNKFDAYRLKVLYCKRYNYWKYDNKKYSILEKLFLLPLMILPFKMELIDWKIKYSKFGKVSFFTTIMNEWWLNRKALIRGAYLYSIGLSNQAREVELL